MTARIPLTPAGAPNDTSGDVSVILGGEAHTATIARRRVRAMEHRFIEIEESIAIDNIPPDPFHDRTGSSQEPNGGAVRARLR